MLSQQETTSVANGHIMKTNLIYLIGGIKMRLLLLMVSVLLRLFLVGSMSSFARHRDLRDSLLSLFRILTHSLHSRIYGPATEHKKHYRTLPGRFTEPQS